jgi:hypothetical protein
MNTNSKRMGMGAGTQIEYEFGDGKAPDFGYQGSIWLWARDDEGGGGGGNTIEVNEEQTCDLTGYFEFDED